MTRDEWTRVKGIVAGALFEPEARRGAYLTAQCGSDVAIRQQVESLLTAAMAAADLYESAALSVNARVHAPASLPVQNVAVPADGDSAQAPDARTSDGEPDTRPG